MNHIPCASRECVFDWNSTAVRCEPGNLARRPAPVLRRVSLFLMGLNWVEIKTGFICVGNLIKKPTEPNGALYPYSRNEVELPVFLRHYIQKERVFFFFPGPWVAPD